MIGQNTYGGVTLTNLMYAATPLAASASGPATAMSVRNYNGVLTGFLTATSATGDETLFVEFMQAAAATSAAATQLANRRYFTTVSNPTSGKTQRVQIPVDDVPRGFLKVRMTTSAASVYRVQVAVAGVPNRIDA